MKQEEHLKHNIQHENSVDIFTCSILPPFVKLKEIHQRQK